MNMQVTPGFPKRKEGRDEVIVAPEIPIVDAHHHLFDRPTLRYLYDDYRADTDLGHRVIATVYIETQAMARQTGPDVLRALGEVEFAAGVGAMADSGIYGECRVGAAMVGFADMTLGARIAPFLDAAMAMSPQRFRGVRQIALSHPDPQVLKVLTHKPPADLLASDTFDSALAEVGRRGLTFDVAVFHNQLPELAKAVARHPDVIFVLDHLGLAIATEPSDTARAESFRSWLKGMTLVAERENVVCKVGGLGTSYWRFPQYMSGDIARSEDLAQIWKPYVEAAMEVFGADRCMAESNFPNDGRSAGFVPLWNALKTAALDASKDEIGALFHGTAIRVYRMEGVEVPAW